jgi:hypothetical protein
MAEIEIVVYITVFLLGLFFSLLALDERSSVASFISWVVWFALAGFHLAYLYDTVFLSLSWLYFGLGLIFLVNGFALVVLSMQGKPDKDLELA